MKAIVFVGHGDLPLAMKQSAQMIAGENQHLFAVSLTPDDGKEEFAEKLQKLNEQLTGYDQIQIFADLMGGSPSNGAVEKYVQQENVTIISGMNLPMILTAVMGDVPIELILAEGKEGIRDVKAELRGEIAAPVVNRPVTDKNSDQPSIIENVRVDARGIHGQVATQWVPKLAVDRIIVIDDLAVKDETQKMALKMAKPNTVKLSILSTKKAVERLSEPTSYLGEKLLIIIQRIDTLASLAELGYYFETVNMGNVPNRPETKAYRKTVHLTKEEVQTIKLLIEQGTHFTAQMVPNDNVTDFDAIILL